MANEGPDPSPLDARGALVRSDAVLAGRPPADGGIADRMRMLLDRPLGPDDIDENTRLVALPADARESGLRSLLVFRLRDEHLAIDAIEAHRVLPAAGVRRVPHRSNAVFAGIANLGGEITLVCDLAAALGIAGAAAGTPPSHVIVFGTAESRWAFAVEGIVGVRRVPASSLLPAPATVRHAVDGCAKALVPRALCTGDPRPASARSGSLPADDGHVGILDSARLAALFARSLA